MELFGEGGGTIGLVEKRDRWRGCVLFCRATVDEEVSGVCISRRSLGEFAGSRARSESNKINRRVRALAWKPVFLLIDRARVAQKTIPMIDD